jgi:hypothetical protein
MRHRASLREVIVSELGAATDVAVNNSASAAVQSFLGHRDPRVTLGVYALVESKDLPKPSSLHVDAG